MLPKQNQASLVAKPKCLLVTSLIVSEILIKFQLKLNITRNIAALRYATYQIFDFVFLNNRAISKLIFFAKLW